MVDSINPTDDNSDSNTQNWFASWFDTKYYHILYKERNYREAQVFMDNLTHYLNLPEKAKVLDLACGKGRHSIYLKQLGFDVLGVDLSENSIEKFDAIFNLFTSFGYFENEADNQKTLCSIKESLSEYGFAVIDFMNVQHVIENLIANEVKVVDDIEFKIKRFLSDDNFIIKEIDFEDNGTAYHFVEKVKAFTLDDFQVMMEKAGIFLLDTFGDYKLKKFHKKDSERLIMIFK